MLLCYKHEVDAPILLLEYRAVFVFFVAYFVVSPLPRAESRWLGFVVSSVAEI